MNSKISIIAVVVSVLMLMSSCLSSSDSDTVYYDDAAIISFSLGTLNRTMHTTSSKGQDSTYTSTVSCSSYAFTIDQKQGLIYNVDSLPAGTRTDKSLVTISSLNSGYIFIKSLTSDTLTSYSSSSDSLDFSQPRELYCYSSDGVVLKKYTVDVRVHTETTDSFYWKQYASNANIARIENLRALSFNKSVLVYGTEENVSKAYIANINNPDSWTEYPLPSQSAVSIATSDNKVYVLADGNVYSTPMDASQHRFTQVAAGTLLKTLLGSSRTEMYAVNNDDVLVKSTDGGITWVEDELSDGSAYLPKRDFNGICASIKTNTDIDKFVLIGNRGDDNDRSCVVWSKVVDTSDASRTENWMYNAAEAYGNRVAPSLEHLTATAYNDGIILIGGNGIGACNEKAFANMYFSRDNGQNWWVDDRFSFPSAFSSSKTSFAMVSDTANYIWLICGSTGQIWRGHLAQLVWE